MEAIAGFRGLIGEKFAGIYYFILQLFTQFFFYIHLEEYTSIWTIVIQAHGQTQYPAATAEPLQARCDERRYL